MRLIHHLSILAAAPLLLALSPVAHAQAEKAHAQAEKAHAQAEKAPVKAAPEAAKPSAEVKVGTGVENRAIVGEAAAFTVEAGTKIYVWTRVSGITEGVVNAVFSSGEKTSKVELKVPYSPYRTHAYRTFRKGDGGNWTVKLVGADGAELGSATFTVEVK